MVDENDRSIENELEYEDEAIEIDEDEDELEYEEEISEIDENEDEDEDELDELDEIEELEEMTPPRLTSWVDADGKKHQEIVVINNDIGNIIKNKLDMIEPCSICSLPFSTRKRHRICSLPCGHLYGSSCIKKWLLQSSSGGECPQCSTVCKYKDVRLLYASRVCASAHQKASSTRHFPFTKQGLKEFREHERLRCVDTEKMHAEDSKNLVDAVQHQFDAAYKRCELLAKAKDLFLQVKELKQRAETLGQADAVRQRARALDRRSDVFGRRCAEWTRRADVLEQRTGELERRLSAFKRSSNFFNQMCKEHLDNR